jgi:hypothetical protein
VFSWFNRGLLPVAFDQGDWVRYAVEEIDEYGTVRDTLTVTVVDADSSEVWLLVESPSTRDFVALDPGRLHPGESLLPAIRRVVHDQPEGLVEEDVRELRESALVQRHFTDPFENPEVSRRAIADTLIAGTSLQREAVELVEERRQEMGAHVLVTRLRARARLSAGVPLIGLLESWTLSEVTTEAASGGERDRRRPPLTYENSLRCIGFGSASSARLPEALRPGN